MTRVLVQRGSSGGGSTSSNPNRSGGGSSSNSSARAEPQVPVLPVNSDEVVVGVVSDEVLESGDKGKSDESVHFEQGDGSCDDGVAAAVVVESDVREEIVKGLSGLRVGERVVSESEVSSGDSSSLLVGGGGSCPPPPPVPPPKPSVTGNLNPRRSVSGSLNSGSVGSSRRAWPVVSARTSPVGSRPSSPRSHNESEGYNSADEQKPCLVSSYDDFVS